MKFGYTIVYVSSVAEALAFYARAFGFRTRFLHASGQYGELDTGDTTLAFAALEMGAAHFGDRYVPLRPDVPPPGIELAFVADDVQAAFDRAVAAGATPLCVPEDKPWGQVVAYVRAQEGTLIELCSPMPG